MGRPATGGPCQLVNRFGTRTTVRSEAKMEILGRRFGGGGAAVASFATRRGLALIAGGLPVIVRGQVAGGAARPGDDGRGGPRPSSPR
jgi:hypothetical protein